MSATLLLPEQFASSALKIATTAMRTMTAVPEDAALPLAKRERAHEIEQSELTQARDIMLSPLRVSKDEQGQSPPRSFMMFQI
jgi:hypothetical protein